MKTLEQLLKEEKNFELLGIYYDSEERRANAAASVVECNGVLSLEKIDDYGNLRISARLTNETKHSSTIYTVARDYLHTINQIEPGFAVEGSSFYRVNDETFLLQITYKFSKGRETEERTIGSITRDFRPGEIFNDYLATVGHIPKQLEFHLRCVRTSGEKERQEAFKVRRNNLDVKDYFARVCNSEVFQTQNYYSRGKTYPRFYGEIKHNIWKQSRTEAIFLIEYLYGITLRKDCPQSEIYQTLRGLPYSDFGIKDYVKMRHFVDCIQNSLLEIPNLLERLEKLGLKPKTDLKRWLKKSESNPTT